ncbi:hypothetical protein RB595_010760 [Gaeumannomyces hyphopodioides]
MLALQYPPPTMPRAANDSFLPSGAVHDDMHLAAFPGMVPADHSSVISPLALPRGAAQYFEAHHLPPVNGDGPGPVLSYYPGGSLAPAAAQTQQQQAPPSASSLARSASSAGPYSFSPSLHPAAAQKPQAAQFISPRLAPTSTQIDRQLRQQTRQQQRSASLSPTRRSASLPVGSALRNHSAMASPSRVPFSSVMVPLDAAVAPYPGVPASAPVELPSAPYNHAQPPMLQARQGSGDVLLSVAGQQAQNQRIALLEKQNTLIRQAWESERRYLEANRSRAEEVYQEERAIMDMERTEWEAERVALMDEIARLKDQAKTMRSGSRFGHVESIPEEGGLGPSLRGGGSNDLASPGSASTALSSLQGGPQHRGPRVGATQTAPFQSKASQSHADPKTSPSSTTTTTTRISPSRQPESSPFIPLTQEPHPASSSTAVSSEQQHSAATMSSAPHSEDEQPAPSIDVQDIHPELEGIPLKKKAVHRATFIDGDNGHEGSRAGSKPSSTETSPNLDNAAPDDQRPDTDTRKVSEKDPLKVLAASETERLRMNAGHTPNHSLSLLPSGASTEAQTTASSSGEVTPTTATGFEGDSSSVASKGKEKVTEEPVAPPATKETTELEGAPTMATDEDPPLTGPLTLRNLPAKDAKFFDLLDKKLEDVSKGETDDALPKVLQSDTVAGPSGEAAAGVGDQKRESKTQHSSQASSRSEPDTGLEIPLRIRKTINFGAPLGEIRSIPPH